MSQENKSSVYDLKQAERVLGKWDKKASVVKRASVKIPSEIAEKYNEKNFKNSGSFYELNKTEDGKYQKAADEKRKSLVADEEE